jgi:hypothetical protein
MARSSVPAAWGFGALRARAAGLTEGRLLVGTLVAARELLVLLLCADLVFILLHAVHSFTPHLPDFYANITYERGAGETAQFLKEFWLVLALGWLAVSVSRGYVAWALMFGYVLVDDVFMLHERLGSRTAEDFRFPYTFGVRPWDLGELTFVAAAGCACLVLVALAYRRGGAAFRSRSRPLLGLVAGLSFFAVAVDLVHGSNDQYGQQPMSLVEDGGEMLCMSLILAYAIGMVRAREPSLVPRPGSFRKAPMID